MAFSVELPKPSDSPEEQWRKLSTIVDTLGGEEYFNFKRYLTDNKNATVGRFQETLAAQLLRDEMAKNPTLDFEHARRQLAARLEYDALSRTNLYKLIDAGLVLINRDDLKKYKPKKNPAEKRGRPRKNLVTV